MPPRAVLDFLDRAEHDELLGLAAKGLTGRDLDAACAEVHDHYDRLRRLACPTVMGPGAVSTRGAWRTAGRISSG